MMKNAPRFGTRACMVSAVIFTSIMIPLSPNQVVFAQAPSFVVIDLGTLGGPSSNAIDINNNGQIVGGATMIPDGNQYAFLWHTGAMANLGTLTGHDFSQAWSINDSGQIAGYSHSTISGVQRAFLWQEGVMQDLGLLGGTVSYATAINNLGQVVGGAKQGSKDVGFLWEEGVMQALSNVGSGESVAYAINDAAEIVGSYFDGAGYHAAYWHNGTVQLLEGLGGDNTVALAINNAGSIVGYSTLGVAVQFRAVIWQDGTVLNLGTLGGDYSFGWDINVHGQVVGHATLVDEASPHAFLWQDGVMHDLNALIPENTGWILLDALGINDHGQIVGHGLINGDDHAFLLTPQVATSTVGTILPPVRPNTDPLDPALDVFRIKSVVPIRFQVYHDAERTELLTDPSPGLAAQLRFFRHSSETGSLEPVEYISAGKANSGDNFPWSGSPDYQFIYNLKTTGKSPGTYGAQLILFDGTTAVAQSQVYYFILK